LQVIDTADGSEVDRMKSEAYEIDLSDDGTTLYLRGATNDRPWTDLLDANSLKTITRVDGQLLFPAQTLSGKSLVVGSPAGQWARAMNVFDKVNYSPVSQLPGKGYWVSTP
jgi:hypothetical protein